MAPLTLRDFDKQLANALIHEVRAIREVVDARLGQLDQLQHRIHQIMATQVQIREKLDAVTKGVADEKTEIGGMRLAFANLAALIKALQDQVAAAGTDIPQDIVDTVDALNGAVNENKQAIHDEVAANTMPAPAPATP